MKKMLLLAALGGFVLAVSGPAWAEHHGEGAGPNVEKSEMKHDGHKKDKMMERVDTDGDGIITESEFLEAHKHRFQEIDSNKDGQISKEEAQAHREKMHEKMKEHRKMRKERMQEQQGSPSGASE